MYVYVCAPVLMPTHFAGGGGGGGEIPRQH